MRKRIFTFLSAMALTRRAERLMPGSRGIWRRPEARRAETEERIATAIFAGLVPSMKD